MMGALRSPAYAYSCVGRLPRPCTASETGDPCGRSEGVERAVEPRI